MRFWTSVLVLGWAMLIAACGTATNVKGTELRGGAESSGLLELNTPDIQLGICHHTDSTDNNWVYLEIDGAAIPAHQAHGDVFGVHSQADCEVLAGRATPMPGIPTVTPFAPAATETATGEAQVSTGKTVTPLPAAVNGSAKVGICHRTKSDSNPYVYIVVSLNAVQAHRKHGDIIGVAAQNGCPKTAIRGAGNGNSNHGNGKGNGKHKGNGKNKNKGNDENGEKKD